MASSSSSSSSSSSRPYPSAHQDTTTATADDVVHDQEPAVDMVGNGGSEEETRRMESAADDVAETGAASAAANAEVGAASAPPELNRRRSFLPPQHVLDLTTENNNNSNRKTDDDEGGDKEREIDEILEKDVVVTESACRGKRKDGDETIATNTTPNLCHNSSMEPSASKMMNMASETAKNNNPVLLQQQRSSGLVGAIRVHPIGRRRNRYIRPRERGVGVESGTISQPLHHQRQQVNFENTLTLTPQESQGGIVTVVTEAEKVNLQDAVVVFPPQHGGRNKKQILICILCGVLFMAVAIVALSVLLSLSSSTHLRPSKNGDGNNDTPTTSGHSAAATTAITNLPPTLEVIRQRGSLSCFHYNIGLGYEFCRMIAAAIFGDPNRFESPSHDAIPYVTVYDYIANGTVDLAVHAYTMSRDFVINTRYGYMNFAHSIPIRYTGLVVSGIPEFVDCAEHGDTLLGSCRNLTVCTIQESTAKDFVDTILPGVTTIEIPLGCGFEFMTTFLNGTCNAFLAYPIPELTLRKIGYTGPYKVGTKDLTRQPVSAVSRGDDPEFEDFVNWVLRALIVAEGKNITKEKARQFPTTMLFGEAYKNMFINALSHAGNYGEWYESTQRCGGVSTGSTTPDAARDPRINYYCHPRGIVNELNFGDTGLIIPMPFGGSEIDEEDFQDEAYNYYAGPFSNGTLKSIVERDYLVCGIVGERPGLGIYNTVTDEWIGLDADYCRGLAAATLFGRSDLVEFVVFDTAELAFVGLAQGKIDIFLGAPFTIENDVKEPTTGIGFAFGPVYFYGTDTSLALATRQDDREWSDFVKWMTIGTFYAEENNITSSTALDMPVVNYFGITYKQALGDMIVAVGNYGDMYQRNMETYVPRSGRNQLNKWKTPQMNPMWEF